MKKSEKNRFSCLICQKNRLKKCRLAVKSVFENIDFWGSYGLKRTKKLPKSPNLLKMPFFQYFLVHIFPKNQNLKTQIGKIQGICRKKKNCSEFRIELSIICPGSRNFQNSWSNSVRPIVHICIRWMYMEMNFWKEMRKSTASLVEKMVLKVMKV